MSSFAIHFTPGPNGTVRIEERYENAAGRVGHSDYLVEPGAACCGIPFDQLAAAGYGIIDEFEDRAATIRRETAT